ncbi:MAG: tyrosine-type recombinase/integrase [Polyangiaceae bacterium]|nr:tyrosine-type recombinase/integrase [Polyangiaceae bacterium]
MSTKKIARQDITGNVFLSRGRWYARLPLGGGKRHCSPMPWAEHEEQARARVGIMAELAVKVRSTGDAATIETLPSILERAAKSTDPAELDRLRELVSRIVGGKVVASKSSAAPIGETFGDVAKAWTSGELAKKYPDHVKAKKDDATDGYRLDKHVLPIVGAVPLRSFTLAHAERVLEQLPSELSPASRRHVAQLVQRVLGLAVYPSSSATRLPSSRLAPKKGTEKAKAALYPADEARLVSSPDVLLCERVLFGFLAREGMRTSEAAGLTWGNLDLDVGRVRLDENKTDDPRAWALSPDVARVLRWWRDQREAESPAFVEPGAPVFVQANGDKVNVDRLAERLRLALGAAGVKRPELFEATSARLRLRAHDLRGTFVTVSLATGRSETWVMDRTGHTTSAMLARYRRLARTFEELDLGPLQPFDRLLGIQDGRNDHSSGAKRRRFNRETPRKAARRKRHYGFRFQRRKACEFESRLVHHVKAHGDVGAGTTDATYRPALASQVHVTTFGLPPRFPRRPKLVQSGLLKGFGDPSHASCMPGKSGLSSEISTTFPSALTATARHAGGL